MASRIVILLLLALPAFGASWYVSPDATSTFNGTSWANAWTNFATVVWGGAGVVAGDTLYIDGGESGKTYTTALTTGASGTQAAPITIMVGQDAGHNGKVTISNLVTLAGNWITLNGGLTPTATFTGTFGTNELLTMLQSNINLTINNRSNHGVLMQGTNGNVCKWVEADHCGEAYLNGSTKYHGIVHYFNAAAGSWVTNCAVSYCLSRSNIYDGINFTANNGHAYNALEISYCVAHDNGDDNMQLSDCATVHHCWIEGRRADASVGHPDALQAVGDFFWAHHNFIEGKKNSWIYFEFGYKSVGDSDIGNWRLHDNVFFCRGTWLNAGYGVYFGTQMNSATNRADFTMPAYQETNTMNVSSETFAIGAKVLLYSSPNLGPPTNYATMEIVGLPDSLHAQLKNVETEGGDYSENVEPGTVISTNYDNGADSPAAITCGIVLSHVDVPNVVIANNTFVNGYQNGLSLYASTNHIKAAGITNWIIANNLFHNAATSPNYGGAMLNSSLYAYTYDTDDCVFDYNILSGQGRAIRWTSALYANADTFDAAIGFENNKTNTPTFMNLSAYDLRLDPDDTVAVGAGTNLSALGISEMNYDIAGTERGATWDIGAYQATTNAPAAPTSSTKWDGVTLKNAIFR